MRDARGGTSLAWSVKPHPPIESRAPFSLRERRAA
jgi:hypothetical protein